MGLQKGSNTKIPKKCLFEFLFDFFSKIQPLSVKSVEEFNFNLNIYAYSLKKNHFQQKDRSATSKNYKERK
jgi:hypothetical protein